MSIVTNVLQLHHCYKKNITSVIYHSTPDSTHNFLALLVSKSYDSSQPVIVEK